MYLAYKNGYRRLGFTGGEPTIRRELPKLIAMAKKIGYTYIRIQTNGVRIADYDYCKTLADAGLTFVKFSIHGDTAELHDKLVEIPGAFDKCLKAVENLKKLKVGIGVNIVLNDWNYRRLPEFFKLFLLKLELSNFVIIAPLYEGNMVNFAGKIGAKLTDMAPFIRQAYEVFTSVNFPKPPLLLHFTPCILPGYEQQMLGWSAFNTMVVSPKGERRDLDATASLHATKTEACKQCVYNDRCLGFDTSYARVFGLEEIKPLTSIPERYDAHHRLDSHVGRSVLTDNESCVLEVLKTQSPVTTQRFLQIADGIPLCKDCKDENAVMVAGETLVKMGKVKRRFEKGRYIWETPEGENLA
jgi:MoaA/NifB/PqqE/SkfB family radical SAM enzyme